MSYEYDVVVVAPNAAIDSYYVLSEFAVGEVNRAAETLHTAGGKGNNMARAVTMLGGRALSLGIVGGSSGQFIVDELRREGIAADMVRAEHETRRCSTMPVPGLRQSTVVLENGVPAGEQARAALTAKVVASAAKAPFVTLTGSLPPDFPDDYYAVLARRLTGTARVAVDCSGRTLELAVEARPGIVKVNVKEICSTFGLAAWSWETGAEMYGRLGVELLVITDGGRGAYVFSRDDEPFRVATEATNWVNATGAGDTFMAGLLLSLNRKLSLHEAARFASAAAAASLQQVGSGFLDRNDVEHFLQRTRVETPGSDVA